MPLILARATAALTHLLLGALGTASVPFQVVAHHLPESIVLPVAYVYWRTLTLLESVHYAALRAIDDARGIT